MKIDLKDVSNGQLRDIREGITRCRNWLDGFKAGRKVPGQNDYLFIWEQQIVNAQILLDKLITATNAK